jgi:hypothetical protein
LKQQTLIGSTLLLISLCPFVAEARVRSLTERDKAQIVGSILRRDNFRESETWKDNAENTVYLLAESIPAMHLPQIKGIGFVLIKPGEVDEMKKTGVEYYEFSEFEVRKTSVRVFFRRTYINTSAREASGSAVEYTCRKVAGKWKVKGRLDRVYAS